MNYLLDTHTFVWFINGDKNLSVKGREEIENRTNRCFVSVATLWEIGIKISLRKLNLHKPFPSIMEQIELNSFEVLPITFEHTLEISALSYFHRDPFDRMLIVQAKLEDLTIIGKDPAFDNYKVKRLW